MKTHLKETDGSLPVARQYKAWRADFDCIKVGFVSPGDLNPGVCNIISRHHTSAAVQVWGALVPLSGSYLGYLHCVMGKVFRIW